MRTISVVAAAFALCAFAAAANPQPPSPAKTSAFMSLRTDEANGRRGPDGKQPVVWKYRVRGLPVKTLARSREFHWIEDPAGDRVWMHESQVASTRTVYVLGQGKDGKTTVPLLSAPRAERKIVAQLERGVVARVLQCETDWRRVELIGKKGKAKQGWIKADLVWGGDDCVGVDAKPD
jgi:SH3-like domain-containing protein